MPEGEVNEDECPSWIKNCLTNKLMLQFTSVKLKTEQVSDQNNEVEQSAFDVEMEDGNVPQQAVTLDFSELNQDQQVLPSEMLYHPRVQIAIARLLVSVFTVERMQEQRPDPNMIKVLVGISFMRNRAALFVAN